MTTTGDPTTVPIIADEAGVPDYELPELLRSNAGGRVENVQQWEIRRGEILKLLADNEYGHMPKSAVGIESRVLDCRTHPVTGEGKMKQVELTLRRRDKALRIQLLLFLPEAGKRPAPAFLGLNFFGNHTVHEDTGILLPESWVPNHKLLHNTDNRANEKSRGIRSYRWPVQRILQTGSALVTAYSGDIDPDYDDGFHNGVHGLFGDEDFDVAREQRWGTLAAWSWGLSRIVDYLLANEPEIDGKRIQ
ncbi:MAG: hypothetical protein LR015_01665 [Verrucomicrobia bacterium]|nr:hypothetical protein [Verrucomicrobiota bacterium]